MEQGTASSYWDNLEGPFTKAGVWGSQRVGAGLIVVELLPWRPEGIRRGGSSWDPKGDGCLEESGDLQWRSSQASVLALFLAGGE